MIDKAEPQIRLPIEAPGSVGSALAPTVSVPPSRAARRVLIWLIKLALAAACLTWLASSGRLDFSRFEAISYSTNFALLMLCVVISLALPAVRWWYLLESQGLKESLWHVARITWFGYFAGLFLPGAATGDLAKAVLIAGRQPRDRVRAISTVLVDRYVGLYSLVVMGMAAFLWMVAAGTRSPAVLGIGGFLSALLLVMTVAPLLLLWSPSRRLVHAIVPHRWSKLLDDACTRYLAARSQLLVALAISIAANAIGFSGLYFAGRVLYFGVTPSAVFFSGPLVALANCIPFTPGGIGVGEATSGELLSTLNFAGGADMMLLFRLVSIVFTLPAALLLLLPGKPRRDRPRDAVT